MEFLYEMFQGVQTPFITDQLSISLLLVKLYKFLQASGVKYFSFPLKM